MKAEKKNAKGLLKRVVLIMWGTQEEEEGATVDCESEFGGGVAHWETLESSAYPSTSDFSVALLWEMKVASDLQGEARQIRPQFLAPSVFSLVG